MCDFDDLENCNKNKIDLQTILNFKSIYEMFKQKLWSEFAANVDDSQN